VDHCRLMVIWVDRCFRLGVCVWGRGCRWTAVDWGLYGWTAVDCVDLKNGEKISVGSLLDGRRASSGRAGLMIESYN